MGGEGWRSCDICGRGSCDMWEVEGLGWRSCDMSMGGGSM